jgi:hypothetical protein
MGPGYRVSEPLERRSSGECCRHQGSQEPQQPQHPVAHHLSASHLHQPLRTVSGSISVLRGHVVKNKKAGRATTGRLHHLLRRALSAQVRERPHRKPLDSTSVLPQAWDSRVAPLVGQYGTLPISPPRCHGASRATGSDALQRWRFDSQLVSQRSCVMGVLLSRRRMRPGSFVQTY